MRRPITAAALPLLFVAGLAAQGADKPQNPPSQTTPRPPDSTAAQKQTTTVSGCLYKEDQIAGRKPNVAERAGVLEDYILADASFSATKPDSTPGAAGTKGSTPASGNMYKVEGPSDEKLKALVGKRVELTGRIDPEGPPPGTPRPDRGLGPDKINLPEFEATSIREISGTCSAAPAPRK